ncbi:MAG: IMP dehydrogenase [Patescibacteria group bacterium]|nr:IMP dehydrogenase [Patescibacteria group bacterium]
MTIFTSEKIVMQGLTYDDVLLMPGYASFAREDISLRTNLTRHITLEIPLVAAPMDTVTERRLAIALAKLGGIGIIHRNLTVADQALEVKAVKEAGYLIGAAVGASTGVEERIRALVQAGVDVIVVDSAHGYAKPVIDTIRYIKSTHPETQVIGGSVATYDGAKALIQAGADALRVGMGPGAICTTRIVSGMGVPQITAILETARAGTEAGIPVIADGGIKYSGDMLKALAAGAHTVMMGSYFAATEESPGEVHQLTAQEIPSRFKSIVRKDQQMYTFKSYRGMGSEAAMKRGAEIKSEDEFHGKSYKERVLVAEGVEGLVPVRGTVQDLVDQAIGGLKSGMYYIGCSSIEEVRTKARFMQITQASLVESHPHNLLVTNPGKSYS